MRILAIETSCDDTCVAIIEVKNTRGRMPHFDVLANIVSSQTKIHKQYGGIVPSLAKRAHQENLVPVLKEALRKAGMLENQESPLRRKATEGQAGIKNQELRVKNIEKVLEREPELLEQFLKVVVRIEKPKVDVIAVTYGPGLEPALWAGVNFARALSYWWGIPLVGVDHMEGHIAANFLPKVSGSSNALAFPAICLAVSGGHTQLILVKDILKYKLLGETVDDAAGEGFDKVARLIGLGFPGGPEIERLAKGGNPKAFDFPRPMMHSKDYNFSFSGLKTSVLYTFAKLVGVVPGNIISDSFKKISAKTKKDIAASFQQAAVDVLVTKTIKAAKEYKVKTILLAGGVAANKELRKQLGKRIKKDLPLTHYSLLVPRLATDNAAMIAAAAYFHRKEATFTKWKTLKANGNLKISKY